jgi:hypothetical protein
MIVTGIVKDSAGTLLPNAHVIAGTKGTTTNFDGEYSLDAGKNDSIQFTYIGMTTQIYKAYQVPAVVQLQDDGYNLAEVVLQTIKKPFYKTTGFKLGLATLFLGGLLLGNPKRSTGLKGYAKVEI